MGQPEGVWRPFRACKDVVGPHGPLFLSAQKTRNPGPTHPLGGPDKPETRNPPSHLLTKTPLGGWVVVAIQGEGIFAWAAKLLAAMGDAGAEQAAAGSGAAAAAALKGATTPARLVTIPK